MNEHSGQSIAEAFEAFVMSQSARGLADATLTNYRHHIHSISVHLDIQKPIEALWKRDLEMMIFCQFLLGQPVNLADLLADLVVIH